MEVKFDNYNYYMVYITRILYIVLQSGLHCERMKEIGDPCDNDRECLSVSLLPECILGVP